MDGRYGDRDGDGFIEYGRQSSNGLVNQGWKDSHDSVFHADGALARGPIAIVEVQAYAYAAWRAAERVSQAGSGDPARAELSRQSRGIARAGSTRRSLTKSSAPMFWRSTATRGPAGCGPQTPVTRCSPASPTRSAPRRSRALMPAAPPSAAGASGRWPRAKSRYNPMSYHNGSVWPHDNAMIAAGLAAYGFRNEAAKMFEGLFAARITSTCAACRSSSAGFRASRAGTDLLSRRLLAAGLGGGGAAVDDPILHRPRLRSRRASDHVPRADVAESSVNDLVLRHVRVKGGSADIELRRSGRRVVVDVLARRGPVRW